MFKYTLWRDEVMQTAEDKSCFTFTSFRINEEGRAELGRGGNGWPMTWISLPEELTYELKEKVEQRFRSGESYTLDSGKTRGGLEESYYVKTYNVLIKNNEGECAVMTYKQSEKI